MAGQNPPNPKAGGNAPIKRQGHTSNGKHGSEPNSKVFGNREPRDLKIK